MKATAQDVYDMLMTRDKITTKKGQISFKLDNVSIVVKHKDVVGNIIQEWLEGWLKDNNIDFKPNPNTQMPPDIFLDINDMTKDWLEVKAFNRESNPGFDIAEHKSFVNELIEKPYHLDTDYIIFGYVMDEATGDVIIKDLWLKKIWEITRPMADWPINLQIKNKVVNKMRPGVWYSSRSSIPMFQCMEDFLAAFEESVFMNKDTHDQFSQWRNKFSRSYKNYYGHPIDFPKWEQVKNKYIK